MIKKRNYINYLARLKLDIQHHKCYNSLMTMKVYLTPDDVEHMAQAATCVRDDLLVRVLFWGSCRISEALGIEVDNVDPIQGTVTIKHLKTRIRLLCPQCDTRLSRLAKFCPSCGKEVPEPLRKEQETHRIRTIPLEKRTMERLANFPLLSK